MQKIRKKHEEVTAGLFAKAGPPKTVLFAQMDYTVSAADTLERIAASHDCTVGELIKLNRMSSRMVFPGQKLKVLVPSPDDVFEQANQGVAKVHQPSSSHHSLDGIRRGPGGAVPAQKSTSRTGSMPSGSTEETDSDCLQRILKIKVKQVTELDETVSGTLLVTPNCLMFDPDVMHPLVKEKGPDRYGMVANLDEIVAVSVFKESTGFVGGADKKRGIFDPTHVRTPTEQRSASQMKREQSLATLEGLKLRTQQSRYDVRNKSGIFSCATSTDDKRDLFTPVEQLINRETPSDSEAGSPVLSYYMAVRLTRNRNSKRSSPAASTSVSSYDEDVAFGKKLKREFWYAIPSTKVDYIHSALLQWSTEKYGQDTTIFTLDESTVSSPPVEPSRERRFIILDSTTDESLAGGLTKFAPLFGSLLNKEWELVTASEMCHRQSLNDLDQPKDIPKIAKVTGAGRFDIAKVRLTTTVPTKAVKHIVDGKLSNVNMPHFPEDVAQDDSDDSFSILNYTHPTILAKNVCNRVGTPATSERSHSDWFRVCSIKVQHDRIEKERVALAAAQSLKKKKDLCPLDTNEVRKRKFAKREKSEMKRIRAQQVADEGAALERAWENDFMKKNNR